MTAFPYPYALAIRAVDVNFNPISGALFIAGSWNFGSGGAVSQNTAISPSQGYIHVAPTILGPPTFTKVELPREGLDWSERPLTVGWRPKLHVEWTQLGVTEIVGQQAFASLRTVLNYLTTVGDSIQVALDGWNWAANCHWRLCHLENSFEYKNIDGKDIGLTLALDFSGVMLLTSGVPAVDAISWGSAT